MLNLNHKCRSIETLLWDFESGNLPAEETERVQRHLSDCGNCRTNAATTRTSIQMMNDLSRRQTPESRLGWDDLQNRLGSANVLPLLVPRRSAAFDWRLVPVAAALLLAAVLMRPNTAENTSPLGPSAAVLPTITTAKTSPGPAAQSSAMALARPAPDVNMAAPAPAGSSSASLADYHASASLQPAVMRQRSWRTAGFRPIRWRRREQLEAPVVTAEQHVHTVPQTVASDRRSNSLVDHNLVMSAIPASSVSGEQPNYVLEAIPAADSPGNQAAAAHGEQL